MNSYCCPCKSRLCPHNWRGVLITAMCFLLMGAAFAAPAMAETPVIVVTKSGYYVLTQDGNGGLVTTKAHVVVMGQPPTGEDPDPGDPDPPKNDKISDQIYESAMKANHPASAKGLSILIDEIRKLVQSGEISADDAGLAIKVGWDRAIKAVKGDKDDWEDTYELVESLAVLEAQKGHLTTPVDWQNFLSSVSSGLDRATEGAALDIVAIMELILKIIPILRALFGGG